MKFNVKGLVFVGFAAAILSANAMAATGDEKIVTSKKYVDDTFQTKLTPGTNISIENGTISATNTTYGTLTAEEVTTGTDTTGKLVTAKILRDELNAKANSNALATVATTGAYSDLSGKPNLASVATSGSYTDLSNTPTIGNATLTVKQNNVANTTTFGANATENATIELATPDWTATDQQAGFIANKPNLAAVATSGSYNSLSDKPTTMTAATSEAAGTSGFVPAPAAGDNVKFLTGAGTWDTPTNTTYDTLSAEEITQGTGTTGRLITAAQYAAKQDASTAVKYAGSAVGSATTPVYVDGSGNITASTYTIQTSVPENAVFTDTTYSQFNTTTAGLVPAASASGDTGKYLKGDGTWGTPTDTTYTADGTTITLSNGQFSATAGSIASGNTGLVNGGAVFSYVDGKLVPTLPTDANACTDAAPCALVATSSGMAWVKMAQQ